MHQVPLDREMLRTETEPVRVQTARGPLSYAQSRKILEDLQKRSPGSDLIQQHVAVEEALTGTPLAAGNRVTLLEDGAATYPAMLEAMRNAKHFLPSRALPP